MKRTIIEIYNIAFTVICSIIFCLIQIIIIMIMVMIISILRYPNVCQEIHIKNRLG